MKPDAERAQAESRTGAESGIREERARSILREEGSAVVAFSGGVDSSLVLALALEELGAERVLAATASSETFGTAELEESRRIAAALGARHRVLETSELAITGFRENPPERCYYCKGELYSSLWGAARAAGMAAVVDGANADDEGDYRPGLRAAAERGVRQPLREAGIGKEEVRSLARRCGLPNWDRPARACLSSRFPYGEEITEEKLGMVSAAEQFLERQGFGGLRVRHHGPVARIEVPRSELGRLTEEPLRTRLVEELTRLGYTYVTIDLEGFRSGSMNEVLPQHGKPTRQGVR